MLRLRGARARDPPDFWCRASPNERQIATQWSSAYIWPEARFLVACAIISKVAEGKTKKEAVRPLKRRAIDAIDRQAPPHENAELVAHRTPSMSGS
jgi:hypothetical protein